MSLGKVYTIDANLPFAKILANELLIETKDNPHNLTRYNILLPTRRACRILRDQFLFLNNGQALLLPRISPLGDVLEEELSMMLLLDDAEILKIPPAISKTKRQMLLAKLILANTSFGSGLAQALKLASALGTFLDQIIIENLNIHDLEKIVPDDFAAHWQITLEFLKIISEYWPLVLAEEGCIDVAQRRNFLLQNLASFWASNPPNYPVIAAGSTGSIPATSNLLKVISRLENGRVILPGLDKFMDDESWNLLAESHPQFGMKQLLLNLEIDRYNVHSIEPISSECARSQRFKLVSEIMRPSETSACWKDLSFRDEIKGMLEGVSYFACQSEQEEALVIALLLRQTLEDHTQTAALITPDRTLARRVIALCRRWGISIDDSAGRSLSLSQTGKFLSLVNRVAAQPLDYASFLALLKHPYSKLGFTEEECRKRSLILENKILRTQGPKPQSLGDVVNAAKQLGLDEVVLYIDRFARIFYSLQQEFTHKISFSLWLNLHLKTAEELASDLAGGHLLWSGDEGEACAQLISEFQEDANLLGEVNYQTYCETFDHFLREGISRDTYGFHPRLRILGQLEARLTDADLVILGGLNEGIWPRKNAGDPWMSRPMRRSFGLPALERSIGLSAHDFVQGFCSPRVVMTRAKKMDGTPSVPSRWIQRLDTVMAACGHRIESLTDDKIIIWARHLDKAQQLLQPKRPAPKPPLFARPKKISITRVEGWLKDPYGLYAASVLNLRKLPSLFIERDAAQRGIILHKGLERFLKNYPELLPDQAEQILIGNFKETAKEYVQDPALLSFWLSRIQNVASWYISHEQAWRNEASFIDSELKGTVILKIANGQEFQITGVIDRLDRLRFGGYALIDYKSAGDFTVNKLKSGKLPQLPLEALLLSEGVFENKKFDGGKCGYMGYWIISGGDKGGKITELREGLDEITFNVKNNLISLVEAFSDPDIPYFCVPDMTNMPIYNDYDHLERIREWAALDPDVNEILDS